MLREGHLQYIHSVSNKIEVKLLQSMLVVTFWLYCIPKSQNCSKISGFQKKIKLRFCIILMNKNCHNSLAFVDIGLKFYIKTNFYSRKNHIFASRSKDHFLELILL